MSSKYYTALPIVKSQLALACRLAVKHHLTGPDLSIARQYLRDITPEAIAKRRGISVQQVRQSIRQILMQSIDAEHGLRVSNRKRKATIKRHAKERHIERTYGMGYNKFLQVRALTNAKGKNLLRLYYQLKFSTARYDKNWALTFPQWLDVWKRSGKIDYIGTKRGDYRLWRIDKARGFMPGNVQVVAKSIANFESDNDGPRLLGKSIDEYRKNIKLTNDRGEILINIFLRQVYVARHEGVPWTLTFKQWLGIWKRAGHLPYIGLRKSVYRLARIDFTKGFVPGNVEVVKSSFRPVTKNNLKFYGVSMRDYYKAAALTDSHGRQLIHLFRERVQAVTNRGVRWTLTFSQWHNIWKRSGHLDHMATKYGDYRLQRISRKEGFVPGNVRVSKNL